MCNVGFLKTKSAVFSCMSVILNCLLERIFERECIFVMAAAVGQGVNVSVVFHLMLSH